MHCAAPTVCLLWGAWGVVSRGFIMESGWHYGAAIPLSQVVVKVSYCVWYWDVEPAVVVVNVIICD
jgi:hypothetical protein